ncbi:MAG: carbon monoxide dehydrogenase subunit G [Salibacteraceae bacterium]|jgi:carbon monoxide dehydrogenase subunit G
MTTQESILIKVTTEKLFSYLMDVSKRKEYIPALEEVIMLDPLPIREGSRYIEVVNIAGKRLEITYQVVVIELNKRITAKALKSIFPIQADLMLMEKGGTTHMTIQLEFKLTGVFRLASGAVRAVARQQVKGILENIKQALENN